MITTTRRQARRLRCVFRRHVLGITHRGSIPPLVFRAEGTQLRAQYRYAGLAIEHAIGDTDSPDESVALPLDALADIEAIDDSPVVIEAVAPERTAVRWQDHGIPQSRDYDVTPLDKVAPFPDKPSEWMSVANPLQALAEASRTCSEDSKRFALGCIELRGATGEIIATDGRQLLIQRGFTFPWPGDVLVKRSNVYAAKGLPNDGPITIGATETFIVLGVGAWTFSLEIQKEARFPEVDRVMPDARFMASRLQLDAEDAAFLAQALDRLPGADAHNAPACLVLNGKVAVRACGEGDHKPTELVLTRSRYSGEPARLNMNRAFLGRALRLGFTEIALTDDKTPVVCRDARRAYALQPLDSDGDVPLSDDVIRIESSPITPPAVSPDAPRKARTIVNERKTTPRTPAKTTTEQNGQDAHESETPTTLAALIAEAEAVHTELTALRSRAGRLVVALRRYRKRERLVASTLASLKELKLQETAG